MAATGKFAQVVAPHIKGLEALASPDTIPDASTSLEKRLTWAWKVYGQQRLLFNLFFRYVSVDESGSDKIQRLSLDGPIHRPIFAFEIVKGQIVITYGTAQDKRAPYIYTLDQIGINAPEADIKIDETKSFGGGDLKTLYFVGKAGDETVHVITSYHQNPKDLDTRFIGDGLFSTNFKISEHNIKLVAIPDAINAKGGVGLMRTAIAPFVRKMEQMDPENFIELHRLIQSGSFDADNEEFVKYFTREINRILTNQYGQGGVSKDEIIANKDVFTRPTAVTSPPPPTPALIPANPATPAPRARRTSKKSSVAPPPVSDASTTITTPSTPASPPLPKAAPSTQPPVVTSTPASPPPPKAAPSTQPPVVTSTPASPPAPKAAPSVQPPVVTSTQIDSAAQEALKIERGRVKELQDRIIALQDECDSNQTKLQISLDAAKKEASVTPNLRRRIDDLTEETNRLKGELASATAELTKYARETERTQAVNANTNETIRILQTQLAAAEKQVQTQNERILEMQDDLEEALEDAETDRKQAAEAKRKAEEAERLAAQAVRDAQAVKDAAAQAAQAAALQAQGQQAPAQGQGQQAAQPAQAAALQAQGQQAPAQGQGQQAAQTAQAAALQAQSQQVPAQGQGQQVPPQGQGQQAPPPPQQEGYTAIMTLDEAHGSSSTISHYDDPNPTDYNVELVSYRSAITVEFFKDVDITKQSPYLIVKLFRNEMVHNLKTNERSYRRRFFFRYTTGAVSDEIAMYSTDGGKKWSAISSSLLIPFKSKVRISTDPGLLLNTYGRTRRGDGLVLDAKNDANYTQTIFSSDDQTTLSYHVVGVYKDNNGDDVMSIDMLTIHQRIK